MDGGIMNYEIFLTVTWAILVYVFYRIGKQEGRDSAVEVVVDQLKKENIIYIDKNGEIKPGKDKKGA